MQVQIYKQKLKDTFCNQSVILNLFVLILVTLMRLGDALGTEPERPHLREPCGVSQASIARQPEQRNTNQTNATLSQDIDRDGLNRLLRMFTRSHLDAGNIISQLVSTLAFLFFWFSTIFFISHTSKKSARLHMVS